MGRDFTEGLVLWVSVLVLLEFLRTGTNLGKWVESKRVGPSEFFGKNGSNFKYKGNYANGSPTQTASGMKVINISDEWTPADEEEVKALPINEKWRAVRRLGLLGTHRLLPNGTVVFKRAAVNFL